MYTFSPQGTIWPCPFLINAAVNSLFMSLGVHVQEGLWSLIVHVCACMHMRI